MNIKSGNLFNKIPPELDQELFETLVSDPCVRIERIVSRGHQTPSRKWYDQNQNEWVMLLSGAARLVFQDGGRFDLKKGDYLLIPAHARHQVTWTDPDQNTIWLAVHF